MPKEKSISHFRSHFGRQSKVFCKWEEIIGVKSNKITIRDTRSQWGSCNVRKHNISISVWLGAYPLECTEYVVVHELVHLLEKGHNARFYGYLDKYYPNWKECRKELKNKVMAKDGLHGSEEF